MMRLGWQFQQRAALAAQPLIDLRTLNRHVYATLELATASDTS